MNNLYNDWLSVDVKSTDPLIDQYSQILDPNINGLVDICDLNNLYQSAIDVFDGLMWKPSHQYLLMSLLFTLREQAIKIYEKNYTPTFGDQFTLSERGKTRYITPPTPINKVVAKAYHDYILFPKTIPHLIYDNGASIKGRGISHARHRFNIHIQEAYKEYGKDTVILISDFSKYYDNIRHEILSNMYSDILSPEQLEFLKVNLKSFEIDVSYMSEDEYSKALDEVFNALEYHANIDKSKLTKEKFLAKSMAIGCQISQIAGVFYATPLDNYIKSVLGMKYYGRYNDDFYIIYNSREFLKDIFYNNILPLCQNMLGIYINPKKTHIDSVFHWNTYLKINYIMRFDGKLVMKPSSETIRREYRRIHKNYKGYMEGIFTLEECINWYKSWRGTFNKFDCGYDIMKLDDEFRKTFHLPYQFKFN